MKQNTIYIIVTTLFFCAIAVVFNFFPRSTISELEKRELQAFPSFSWKSIANGSFTNDISSWYSDSEPYRDVIMNISMLLKKQQGIALDADNHVTFHSGSQSGGEMEPMPIPDDIASTGDTTMIIDTLTRIANAGIIIVGNDDNVRAMMVYGGNRGGNAYAEAANTYKRTFGSSVNIYCMVIPTAIEFYCPEKVKRRTHSQIATFENVKSLLNPDVKAVDIFKALRDHASEDIYLRTDHHWAPLGAYYAAREFAKVAGVPFLDISEYEQHVVHGYVGSMYGYSGDISVKKAPEDFVYWTPNNVSINTTYIIYSIDKDNRVVSESKPRTGQFFHHHKDGSGQAYCTFMGSDTRITNVKTSTRNGRRLLILKDSFGNALPGWLFGSFEEINIIDCRYFTKNMVKFVEDNKITDILFANNVFKAYSAFVGRNYVRFLSQNGGIPKRAERVSASDTTVRNAVDTVNTLDLKPVTVPIPDSNHDSAAYQQTAPDPEPNPKPEMAPETTPTVQPQPPADTTGVQ